MWSLLKWLLGLQEKSSRSSRNGGETPNPEDRLIRVLGLVDLVLLGWDLVQALMVLAG